MTKMQVKINHSDLKLLLENTKDLRLWRKFQDIDRKGQYFDGDYPTGRYLIDISSTDAESIADVLSDLMIVSGIDDDGELNALGHQIERLIDTFNVE